MFKLFNRFKSLKSNTSNSKSNSGTFHPDTPVIPQNSVDIQNISVFRRENFPQNEPTPWLDRPDAAELVKKLVANKTLSPEEGELCYKWSENGYVIIPGLFDRATLDSAWTEYERAIADGKIKPEEACVVNGLPGRNLNTHFQVKQIEQLLRDRRMTNIISMLLGAKCLPFQTITGHNGSQQLEHSDAIHMTTYPMDYLAATWTTFEDIDPDSGPLVYYPKSHRIPHFLSQEAEISTDEFERGGYIPYHEKYEPQLQKIIKSHQLEPKYFHAKKGDVLIWHSNLIHGGSPRKNMQLSRNALVCHYFAAGCICYHDLASSISHVHS
ncbi:phytanoyl-CoA dioxygenase family protein [Waterburya agarophytonicola K14]|uniref:Phytanoyl-CoA dioxygenase family protein n=1 Tax=Waterburya agarophytonicola KI4 TaxID=2874699 RepID=A0A964BM79_9CYAN|nr:phytanoyl-CoA dioxygenase family protein [Waterburya agarophytonicola]MCC0175999.1 phytanoyl-CoA dioxygenase family protein [Waterburya agarophytonicola KI4]